MYRTDDVARWHREFNKNTGPDLVRALLLAGFDAVWIDRYGYEDSGKAIVDVFAGLPLVKRINSDMKHRYVYFDLTAQRAALRQQMGEEAYQQAQAQVLKDPRIAAAGTR